MRTRKATPGNHAWAFTHSSPEASMLGDMFSHWVSTLELVTVEFLDVAQEQPSHPTVDLLQRHVPLLIDRLRLEIDWVLQVRRIDGGGEVSGAKG